MTIRVVVADDQALVRKGFGVLLTGEPDIEVVGEAANGAEAVALALSLAIFGRHRRRINISIPLRWRMERPDPIVDKEGKHDGDAKADRKRKR